MESYDSGARGGLVPRMEARVCTLEPPSIRDDLVNWKEEVAKTSGNIKEMTTEDGIRRSPILKGQSVLIIAEFIPTWLPIVDSWGAGLVSLFCEKELIEFRHGLKLKTPVKIHRSLAGTKSGKWWKERQKIVLVQGSADFVLGSLYALESIKEDQVIQKY